jgi:hypothetical protein
MIYHYQIKRGQYVEDTWTIKETLAEAIQEATRRAKRIAGEVQFCEREEHPYSQITDHGVGD